MTRHCLRPLMASVLGLLILSGASSPEGSELALPHDQLMGPAGGVFPTDAISYQGELLADGQPVEGPVDLRFSFWSAAAGGSLFNTVTIIGVPVSAGRFATAVPALFPDDGQAVFMEVLVNREQPPQFHSLGRQALIAAPFAVHAETARSAASAQSAETATSALTAQTAAFAQAPWIAQPGGIGYAGRVGIGTTGALALPLEVRVAAADSLAMRVRHQGTAGNATALQAEVTGSGSGGGAATAIQGIASASSGSTIAVHAATSSPSGIGVFSFAQAVSGASDAVLARNASSGGIAVRAWASAPTGTSQALQARNDSPDGYAGYFVGARNHFSGRVGVGVTAPSDRLHIAAPAGEPALRVQIDGATKLRVTANGGVAIGANATPPANGLFVEGGIQVSPTTRWLSIDGRTFEVNNSAWTEGQTIGTATPYRVQRVDGAIRGDMVMSAPVHLPHGASVTELRAWVNDSSPDHDVRVNLMRRVHATGVAASMAQVGSTGVQAGVVVLSSASISPAVIDNEAHAYYLVAAWTTEATAALAERNALLSARLTYQVASPMP
ncbi:MAG: hypothetical protein KF823_03215 [Xanthomonadales bacterium]|nr:hypothetical protein [Xanthomonadales bacterium]